MIAAIRQSLYGTRVCVRYDDDTYVFILILREAGVSLLIGWLCALSAVTAVNIFLAVMFAVFLPSFFSTDGEGHHWKT